MLTEDRSQASYVSPSDDIMSPCSKKLSDLKGKRFKKYVPCLVYVFPGSSLDRANVLSLLGSWRWLTDVNYRAGKPPSLFAKLGKKSFEQSASSSTSSPTAEQGSQNQAEGQKG